MANNLTPQQRLAVENRGGKLLVSAAAGSGKTKVLVDRLMLYLTDPVQPANLDEFLIITYTKAAAAELRGKIAAKLTEEIAQHPENRHLQKQMQRLYLTKISTVHGFCGDLLREYAYKLDISADFRVADENECSEIRDVVMQDLLEQAYCADTVDEDFLTFVNTQGMGRDDRLIPEILLKAYDSSRCHLDPDQWLEDAVAAANASEAADVSQTVWGKYLMEDLFRYLDAQLFALKQCAVEAEACGSMEKAAANLRETVIQLETLRGCKTWDDIVRLNCVDYGRLTFPRKNPDPELTERIKAVRNACKKGLEKKLSAFADPSVQVLQDMGQCAAGVRGMVGLVQRFDKLYRQAKNSRRVLDFGDLEHKTLDLLLGRSRTGRTAAAREIGERFREIMVDEYQDSNGVQDAIFRALTEEKQNCFMVGDVKQSIYQFRLADPGIFLEKYHSYLPAEEAAEGMGRKVFLSHNFRSGGEIIEAVNQVFRCCMSPEVGGLRYGNREALQEGIPHEPLGERGVELYGLEIREDTYAEEAAFVAERIRQMLDCGTLVRKEGGMKPVEPEDIVILLRSPGSVGERFQQALERKGIRCASGGGMDLLQTEEIGTIRSLLQVIVNPRQDIPLISVLASPVFGFTADDLARIRGKNRNCSFYDAMLETDLDKAKEFLEVLAGLRREARNASLTQLLESCLRQTRMDSIYGAMASGAARQTNLQTFYQLAVDYEKGSLRDVVQFLDHLTALEGKGLIAAGSGCGGCVTIMSIHKSKGLEFPVVFLAGLSRVFNRESLQAPILCDKELGLGLSVADTANRVRYPSVAKRAIMVKTARESLSEEMRVLYVAMTRARDRLVMTYAAKNLEADLKDIAQRMELDNGTLLCMDAVCPGEWVLLSAMGRTEAGELHALGGSPRETTSGSFPWKIAVTAVAEEGERLQQENIREENVSAEQVSRLRSALSFRYGFDAATRTPSKQTATGWKGRLKDQEVAENSQQPAPAEWVWREPSFRSESSGGRAYGNVVHNVMQFIKYENCGSEQSVRQEVDRMVRDGLMTREQADMVNTAMIAAFFETEPGQKLRSGISYVREFKFSVLDDGDRYGDGLAGEQVLLQGVVDCALLEEDGLTVIDFKSDRITEDTAAATAAGYAPQLQIYAHAMSRIYEMPVKQKLLYFFRLGRFMSV